MGRNRLIGQKKKVIQGDQPKPLSKVDQIKQKLRLKLAEKNGGKKICLTMIVKNESKNMPRLLDSIKDVIDMISIVDTGSTDNTEEVILEWGKKNNIDTTVHHEPFKNFSHNRTHSVRAAKERYPEADYFLLSDADFVWENHNFNKSLLIDHKYLVEQYNKSLSYWNIRLLSSIVDWECIGVTHEYWHECSEQSNYKGQIRTTKMATLKVDDKEDGGCKSDKFVRDERLLREGLEDDQTSSGLKSRYKFYLAQTLKDMGRYNESIEWYQKRADDGGWPEEVYYSKFQKGFNYEQIAWKLKHAAALRDKPDLTSDEANFVTQWNPSLLNVQDLMIKVNENVNLAAENYLDAYNYRKTRAESIYYMTRMYRLMGMNQKCYESACIGKDIPYPKEDSLFIERACYDYLFDFELSICCYYLPEHFNVGRESISKLLTREDLPLNIKQVVEQNSRFYV